MTSLLLGLGLLCPQDLLDRRNQPLEFPEVSPKTIPFSREEGGDFGCSSFDLQASFKSLFDRNVREEFLQGSFSSIQSELAGSPLVLACYASPTVCDAIKHYRASANVGLSLELDSCRSLEPALDDTPRRAQARAVKSCLEQKARRGVPLDQAMQACRTAREVPGFDGKPVREIDVSKELGLSGALTPPVTIEPGAVRGDARPTLVMETYEARRRESLKTWEEAVRDPQGAPLESLGVSREEIERIALMDPMRRMMTLRRLASAAALGRIIKESHAEERALEAGELRSASDVREELERRRGQLRREVERLMELAAAEMRLDEAMGQAMADAEADVARRAAEHLAPRRSKEATQSLLDRVSPWGCEVKR